MKNSLLQLCTGEYRILEYAGMSERTLSVYCPRLRHEEEISFFNLFSSPSLFFTLRIFDAPTDYRIAIPDSLLNQICITVSTAVRVFRKAAAPLRKFFRKVIRPGTVYLLHCILRL